MERHLNRYNRISVFHNVSTLYPVLSSDPLLPVNVISCLFLARKKFPACFEPYYIFVFFLILFRYSDIKIKNGRVS